MKHKKAAKLYKELGKEIPPHEITGDTEPKPEVPVVGRELIETQSDASKSSKVLTIPNVSHQLFFEVLNILI